MQTIGSHLNSWTLLSMLLPMLLLFLILLLLLLLRRLLQAGLMLVMVLLPRRCIRSLWQTCGGVRRRQTQRRGCAAKSRAHTKACLEPAGQVS